MLIAVVLLTIADIMSAFVRATGKKFHQIFFQFSIDKYSVKCYTILNLRKEMKGVLSNEVVH